MASFGRKIGMKTITIIILLILIISFLLMFFNKKKILIVLSLMFLTTNTLSSIFSLDKEKISKTSMGESKILRVFEGKEIKNTPNVYVLVYDAYSNQETLYAYGLDNSIQMNLLLESGFAIYDGTYSLGSYSLSSIAQLLDISVLTTFAEFRENIEGGAEGLKFFKNNDYDTHILTSGDYMTKGYTPTYTSVNPSAEYAMDSYKIITKAILEGEFRFDAEFSTGNREGFLKAKSMVLGQSDFNTKFVYQHSPYSGHSQNSGILLPNETELHFEKLLIANSEMNDDLDNISKNNNINENLIIILGDHGPYLTKNGTALGGDYDITEVDQLDIQDRFGSFLAIKWPDKSYQDVFDLYTIQDVLPAVIAYMYEDQSIFDDLRLEPSIAPSSSISGASVENGIIIGGVDDSKPLFEIKKIKKSQD